ncbi:MAG: cobalt-precorrin-6A reductase, partial [Actinomycetales bacterium]
VARPRLPVGETRIGGFGGVAGLRSYLRDERVRAVVDATHPFAAGISANAAAACDAEGVPLLRLARTGWSEHPDAGRWHWVDSHADAAALTVGLGSRPFLSIGRQGLAPFVEPLRDVAALVRVVDEPEVELPPAWTLLHSRGPYDLASERALLAEHGVDVGRSATSALQPSGPPSTPPTGLEEPGPEHADEQRAHVDRSR